jgi:adenylate cyclase
MKKSLSISILTLGAGALMVLLVATDSLENWELDVYDILTRAATEDQERSDLVSIIMIDESTLDWGRAYYLNNRHDEKKRQDACRYNWPWDRAVYDLVTLFLAMGEAKVLAFDVELSSPYPSGDESGDETLGDTTFLQNEEGSPFVIHTINFEAARGRADEVIELDSLQEACLDGSSITIGGLAESKLPFDRSALGRYCNPILPYRAILKKFEGNEQFLRLGAVCTQPDSDSVIRRARPLVRYRNWCFPSLGTAAALAYVEAGDGKNASGLNLDGDRFSLEGRQQPIGTIPLTPSGDILIHWRDNGEEGPFDAGYFPTYPAHRVIRSVLHEMGQLDEEIPGEEFLDPADFKNKIVFLGANAVALHDLKAAPVSKDYPGVKVHAAVAEALLRGEAIRQPGKTLRSLIAAVAAAAAIFFTLSGRSGLINLCGILVLGIGYVCAAVWLFFDFSVWIDMVAPLLGMAVAYSGGTTFNYFTEGRKSREISGLFQHFAPPDVVRQLIANPENLFTAGEIREITVFFSDIQGFTSISNTPEMRRDPGRLTAHLNAYLTEMTHAITDCGGTLDKYIGDAVVAIFGAPIALENHALEACRAALECQKRLDAFNARAADEGLPPLVTRIGLYSGDANVGCVGSRDRFSYTAIGSVVNFASRLEGVNKVYGTLVLAGGPTIRMAGDAVQVRRLDSVRVPGLLEEAPPLDIFQVLARQGDPPPLDAALLAGFEEARDLYSRQLFTEAARLFDKLSEVHGDKSAGVLCERARIFAQTPPGDGWDGAFRIDSK